MADDAEPQRKKGGRPRKHAPNAKRPTMSFRISSDLHEKLIASATEGERSLSEEIERRLEASYNDPQIVYKTTEFALNHIVDATLKSQYEKFGGTDSYFASEDFSKFFSMWLKEADIEYPGRDVPWYRDDDKIEEISSKLQHVAPAMISLIASSRRSQNKTLEELAWHFGVKTDGKNKEQIQKDLAAVIEKMVAGEQKGQA